MCIILKLTLNKYWSADVIAQNIQNYTYFFNYVHSRVTGFSPESGQVFFGVTACLPRVSVFSNICLWLTCLKS